MPKRNHGHYCKVCGEYKANENFSGKGHAAHICKKCAALPLEERNQQILLNRMLNLPWQISKEDSAWLKKLCNDRHPEVSQMAKEIFQERFPFAERNERKKQLHIRHLSLNINGEVCTEYGDWIELNATFEVDKKTGIIQFQSGDISDEAVLSSKEMTKFLNRTVNSYEVFSWDEDYAEEADSEDNTGNPVWAVRVQYGNGESQETISYREIPDRVNELFQDLYSLFDNEDEYDWDEPEE